jgi:23S rRNA U2552 (ribose-2'-O)-methylase RlmE/FtsJ
VSGDFFQFDSAFVTNGTTGNWIDRLNARYRLIIEPYRYLFNHRRILDLGAHDGRWMHAALSAGATHVTGVEGRIDNAKRCTANLTEIGYSSSCFDVLVENIEGQGTWYSQHYNLALVLGLLYHVASPIELFRRIARTGVDTIVIDTAITNDSSPSLRLVTESKMVEGNGVDDLNHKSVVLVCHPSQTAIEMALRHFGFSVKKVDLAIGGIYPTTDSVASRTLKLSKENPLQDYEQGLRAIFIASR